MRLNSYLEFISHMLVSMAEGPDSQTRFTGEEARPQKGSNFKHARGMDMTVVHKLLYM